MESRAPSTAERSPDASARSNRGDGGSDRRRALIAVSAELFARQGYRTTTVRQIAEAAGVLSGSLYHHFDSKEAILDAILVDYFDQLLASYRQVADADAPPVQALRKLVEIAVTSLAQHRAAVLGWHHESRELAFSPRFAYLQRFEQEVRELWMRVLDSGVERGDFRADLDAKLVYLVIRDALSVAVRWYQPDGEISVGELTEQYLNILDGIAIVELV